MIRGWMPDSSRDGPVVNRLRARLRPCPCQEPTAWSTLHSGACALLVGRLSATGRRKRRGEFMREVVIVSAVRTPVGRAFKGTLRATRPDEMAAVAIKGALERVPQLDLKEI